MTSNFGVSTGSFAGNRCTPDGLSCSPGDDINFSDGGLADIGGSWGIGIGKGSVTLAAEYRQGVTLLEADAPGAACRRGRVREVDVVTNAARQAVGQCSRGHSEVRCGRTSDSSCEDDIDNTTMAGIRPRTGGRIAQH